MEEPCPICSRIYPVKLLERHVNSCLDTLEVSQTDGRTDGLTGDQTGGRTGGPPKLLSPVATQENNSKTQSQRVFEALGLKADSGKNSGDKAKKGSATLTSILLAEKRLKRKQEELENLIKKKQALREASHVKESEQDGHTKHDAPKQATKDVKSSDLSQSSTIHIPSSPASTHTFQNVNFDILQLRREADLPLAQRLRPKSLADFHGQEKLVGKNGILRNLVSSHQIPSFILWGVPGVGKTSLARIVALTSNHKFVELSGSDSNAKKLKEAFANAQNEKQLTGQKTILFLDEIHRFNKAVQDLLLPVIEKGSVTVIGATTENPSFTLNNALLSRMHTFVMEPLPKEALVKILNRGLLVLNRTRKLLHKLHLIAMNKEAIDYIASISSGDSRVALNILESINAYFSGLHFKVILKTEPELEKFELSERVGVIQVTLDKLKPLLSTRNFHQMYDKSGENHYDTISAFHKAVRGSDADAAVFYLAKMLRGGEDPLFIARRMIVIASEDIGLRDSSCLPFAISAMEALQFVGMPEGEIVLAHCAVKLARAPKSTKSYRALRKAQGILSENPDIAKLPIPMHLRNAPTKLMKELGYGDSYKYNPDYKHGIIKQEFFPREMLDVTLVEDTHLGTMIDRDVDIHEYDNADAEEQDYEEFKAKFKQKQKENVLKQRQLSYMRRGLARSGILSSPMERLASYDENLSRDDQPEYFDGSDNEPNEYNEPNEPDESNRCNAEDTEATASCHSSYDEFLKQI